MERAYSPGLTVLRSVFKATRAPILETKFYALYYSVQQSVKTWTTLTIMVSRNHIKLPHDIIENNRIMCIRISVMNLGFYRCRRVDMLRAINPQLFTSERRNVCQNNFRINSLFIRHLYFFFFFGIHLLFTLIYSCRGKNQVIQLRQKFCF